VTSWTKSLFLAIITREVPTSAHAGRRFMATGSVNKNPHLQQVLFQNKASSSLQPGQVKDSAQLFNSVMSAKTSIATISASGNKINNISNTIKNNGDLQAYEGFQSSMTRASASGDTIKMIRLINSADYAAKHDAPALEDAFAGIAQAAGKDNPSLIDGFNAAFSSTVEKAGISGLRAFNSAFNHVAGADYSGAKITPDQNLGKLFSAVNSVNRRGTYQEENVSNLQRMARGIELEGKADSIWNFFNDFIGLDPEKTIL